MPPALSTFILPHLSPQTSKSMSPNKSFLSSIVSTLVLVTTVTQWCTPSHTMMHTGSQKIGDTYMLMAEGELWDQQRLSRLSHRLASWQERKAGIFQRGIIFRTNYMKYPQGWLKTAPTWSEPCSHFFLTLKEIYSQANGLQKYLTPLTTENSKS